MQPMMTGSIGLLANPSPVPGVTNLDHLVDFSKANPGQVPPHRPLPMDKRRLWAGDMSQLPSLDIKSQNRNKGEETLLCNICEDQAIGWYYGTIICEW
jgi:hypothetical protein